MHKFNNHIHLHPLTFFSAFSVHRARVHSEKTVGDGGVVHAVGHPWYRPGGRGRGVRRALRPVGVHGRRGGRERCAHRRVSSQHDGGGDTGKVREQQSRGRAAGQEAIPGAGLQRARRLISAEASSRRHV